MWMRSMAQSYYCLRERPASATCVAGGVGPCQWVREVGASQFKSEARVDPPKTGTQVRREVGGQNVPTQHSMIMQRPECKS